MVSKKGQKRQAAHEPKAAAIKKAKHDPLTSAVIEGIERASELPKACQKMLLAMLPLSLRVASDERNNYQLRIVEMIGEALDGVINKMQHEVAAEEAQVNAIQTSKDQKEGEVVDAEARLAKAKQAIEEKKVELADVTRKEMAAKASLAQIQQPKATVDAAEAGASDAAAAEDQTTDEAAQAFEAAKAKQQETAVAFSAMQAEQQAAEIALKEARVAVSVVAKELKQAVASRDDKQFEVDIFNSKNIAHFTTLKDQMSKKSDTPMDMEVPAEAPAQPIQVA